jgi:hypothetical protein
MYQHRKLFQKVNSNLAQHRAKGLFLADDCGGRLSVSNLLLIDE